MPLLTMPTNDPATIVGYLNGCSNELVEFELSTGTVVRGNVFGDHGESVTRARHPLQRRAITADWLMAGCARTGGLSAAIDATRAGAVVYMLESPSRW
jgi:hypothetical protein